jgi:type IV pilus assembly protein PilO
LLLALALVNGGLVLYARVYQEPRLVSLQNEWFNRRKGEGRFLDRGSVYDKGVADLATWNSRIPPRKEFARVIGEIYESARSNALDIAGVNYKPDAVKGESLLFYSIILNVSGRYAAAKSFVSDLGRLRDIVIVDGIALSNTKATEENVTLKVNLTVYLKQENE